MKPTKIGKHIKSLREAKGLTMRELDKRSGVSHSYISQIERGEREPSSEVLGKLAIPLGESPLNLLMIAGHINIPDAKPQAFNFETMEIEKLSDEEASDLYKTEQIHLIKSVIQEKIDEIHENSPSDYEFITSELHKLKDIYPLFYSHPHLTDKDKELISIFLEALFEERE